MKDREVVEEVYQEVYTQLKEVSIWVKRIPTKVIVTIPENGNDSHLYRVGITIEFYLGFPSWNYKFTTDPDDTEAINVPEDVRKDLKEKCDAYEKLEDRKVKLLQESGDWEDERGNPIISWRAGI